MSNVIIRLADLDDAGKLLQIYAPYVEKTNISFELEVPTLEEFAHRVESISEMYPYLVCEEDGEILGYAYAGRHRERAAYRFSVDIAVYVSPGHHKRHIATALYTALFSLLSELGYHKACAGITGGNEKSIRLHTVMGFEHVGVFQNVGYKHGRWEDVLWMAKTLRDYNEAPREPISIREINQNFLRGVLDSCRELVGSNTI